MTLEQLAYSVLGLAAIVWICYRQLTWRPLAFSRMWRMPLILAAIGVFSMIQGSKHATLTTLDVAVLAAELLVSLGLGAVMGRIAVIRPIGPEGQRRTSGPWPGASGPRGRTADRDDAPTLETRTGWWGLALWAVLLAVRIGMDVAAQSIGADLVASTGVILLVIAANRVARVAVLAYRVDQRPRVGA